MFSEKDLQMLLDYSAESPVLTVYLNTDPTKVTTEAAKIRLRNMMKTVDLPKDVQAVEDYINLEYDWAAKGVVIFLPKRKVFSKLINLTYLCPIRCMLGNVRSFALSCT